MINIMVSFGNLKVYKNGSVVSQVQRENDHPKIKPNSEEKTTIHKENSWEFAGNLKQFVKLS